MISSLAMVQAHSMAWSEPLFLVLQFVTIFLLVSYSDDGKRKILYASASAAGFSVLVRYSGVALVFAGLVAIFCLHRRSWRSKVMSALQFCLISLLPIGFWIVRNFTGSGSAVNRQVGFHPPTARDWENLLATISSWLLPSWLSPTNKEFAFITALLLLGFAIVYLRRNKPPATGNNALQSNRLLLLSSLVAASHVGVLFASITFFDAQTPIDSRILLPVYASLAIFCVSLIGCLLEHRTVGKQLKPALMAGVLFICALQLTDVSSWLSLSYRQGVGYASREWKDSALIRQIADLSSQTLIGSNAPDVIYTLLGRPSEMILRKVLPETNLPNKNYFPEIAELRKKIRDRNGVVAYFNRVHWRWYLPSEHEIQRDMGLRPIAREKDGSLYHVDSEAAGLETRPVVSTQRIF
jgi:hypothetical protein